MSKNKQTGFGYKLNEDYNPLILMKEFNPNLLDDYRYKIYSYLLGLYFGDGCLIKYPRTKRLVISLDYKYPSLTNEVYNLFVELFNKKPSTRITKYNGKESRIDICMYNCNLGILFPHEGIGEKHLRKIELKDWQKQILDRHMFLKGLIMSDGSSYIRKSTGRRLYNFTNCSEDITNFVCDCLNHFGIIYSKRLYVPKQANTTQIYKIEIAKRESVEKMFSLIGTK